MAEYLPLLERAVAGLSDSTPEARRAIYERARTALLGQLRRMDPPVPERDIERENAALDDAITRVEANFRSNGAPTAAALKPPARTARPAAPIVSRATPIADGLPATEPAAATKSSEAVANAPATPPRTRPVIAPRPTGDNLAARPPAPKRSVPEPSASTEAPPPVTTRPALPARPLNTAPRVGIEPRGTEPRSIGEPRPPTSPALAPYVEPSTNDLPASQLATEAPGDGRRTPGPKARPKPGSDTEPDNEAKRLASEERRRHAASRYLAVLVCAALVIGVAYEAWVLRDRPEQVLAAQQTGDADSGGKVAERAAAQTDETPPAPTAAATAVTPPAASGAASPQTQAPEAASSTEAPATPASPATAPAPETTPAAPAEAAPQALDVADRAALLVAAPDDPQKVKTYPGSVVWKTRSVSAGQGQPLSAEILAEVSIPSVKLNMSMVMQRNLEPQLIASHTIEFRFDEEAGSDIGPIKQIDVPQLRLDDGSPTGDPLAGLAVAITDNNFLVGLSRGKAEASNTLMMQTRNWFDVPMLLGSGKAAKITFEEGTAGHHIIEETMKNWQSGG